MEILMANTAQKLQSNLFYAFASDLQKENEGSWVPISAEVEVKVARYGNTEFEKVQDEMYKSKKMILEALKAKGDTVGYAQVTTTIFAEVIAKTVLKDWKGVTDEKGEEIPYTVEVGTAYLSDPQMTKFADTIIDLSQNFENYRVKKVETAVKN